MLEHHADPGPQARQIRGRVIDPGAIHGDRSLLKGLECIDAFDQGRLARPGRAADHHDLTAINLRGAVRQHLEAAVPLGNRINGNHGHGERVNGLGSARPGGRAQRGIATWACSQRTRRERPVHIRK